MVKNSKNSLKIIITHSKDILQYVDQIVMLHEGKVTCFENVQEAEKIKISINYLQKIRVVDINMFAINRASSRKENIYGIYKTYL